MIKTYTYKDYPDFYNHDFIKSISGNSKWTVSTDAKMPVDAVVYAQEGKIFGARYMGPKSLVTLNKVNELFPKAKDNTYFLNYPDDGFVVLDIEKTCPVDVKKKLLQSNYVYGERSASGRGYHLVFKLPPKHIDFPLLMQKRALRHPEKHYEILLTHYCMFTRAMIPLCKNPTTSFEDIFYDMAAQQKEVIRDPNVFVDENKPDIKYEDDVIRMLNDLRYTKTAAANFGGDISRFEFGFIAYYNTNLKKFFETKYQIEQLEYTSTDQAWLLYLAARNEIPYRAKHDERRNKLPWLLYIASEVIAKDDKPVSYKDTASQP
jgi:hypothetical protein